MADNEWIYDFVIAYLKSPPWRCPLNNFIDANCVKFSDDEENKFEYTDIHKQFCDLIDKLLGGYLKELGLSDEDFLAAVQASSKENDKVNKLIFGQILAVDNFLTFKKMMVKRGKALENKAIKLLANPGAVVKGGNTNDDDADISAMTEEEQLALALKLSAQLAATSSSERKKNADSLEEVLKASVVQADMFRSAIEQEQAELEHAIALSLAMEEERLRKIQAAEAEEKNAKDDKARATAKALKEKLLLEEAKIIATEDAESKGQPNLMTTARLAAAPLPSITMLEERHKAHVEQVETEFKKSEKVKKEKKKKEKKTLTDANCNDDELARRQEFLRAQKQLIAEKRAAAREKELETYESENKSGVPLPASANKVQKNAEPVPAMSAEEEKQQAMRKALAERFKKRYDGA